MMRRRVNKSVTSFRTIRAAKEYLAGKIVEEAKREGAPLTEVERKALYFTESGWTLPEMMVVSAEFDRDYDQDEYEQKIGGLVQWLLARDQAQADQQAWDDAVLKLSDEDHSVLVLIAEAHSQRIGGHSRWGQLGPWLPTLDHRAPREPGDLMRLVLGAGAFGGMILIAIAVLSFFK
jgi:hypothetical protein